MEEILLPYKTKEIEDLVMRIKLHKDKDASLLLLDKFSSLVKHYLYIILYSRTDDSFDGKDKFINLLYSKKSEVPKDEQIKKAIGAIRMIYGRQPKEDIVSDFNLIILNLVDRYAQTGRSFCAYLSAVYPYEILRLTQNYCLSLNIFSSKCISFDFNTGIPRRANIVTDTLEIVSAKEYVEKDGTTSFDWLFNTTDTYFDSLNILEKSILVMYYEFNMPDRMIADILKIHINTINQKRRQAVTTLSNLYGFDYDRFRQSGQSIYYNQSFIDKAIEYFKDSNHCNHRKCSSKKKCHRHVKPVTSVCEEKKVMSDGTKELCISCIHMSVCKYTEDVTAIPDKLTDVLDIKCNKRHNAVFPLKMKSVKGQVYNSILLKGDYKYNRHCMILSAIIDIISEAGGVDVNINRPDIKDKFLKFGYAYRTILDYVYLLKHMGFISTGVGISDITVSLLPVNSSEASDELLRRVALFVKENPSIQCSQNFFTEFFS